MSIFKRIKGFSPLILIPFILVIIWFKDGLLFAGGEEGIPFYDIVKHKWLISSVWHEVGAGYLLSIFLPRIPYISLLAFLWQSGVNEIFLQAATFFVLLSTGSIAVYFLVRQTIGENLAGRSKIIVPLLAAIFYILNPYSMTQVWGRGLYTSFFAFALIPLFLLFFIRALKTKNIVFALLAVVGSFLFSPAFVFPAQVFVIWSPVLVYLVFHIFKNRKKRAEVLSAILIFLFTAAVFLLVHAWWIIPDAYLIKSQYSQTLESAELNLGTLRGVSRQAPLSYLLRLIHDMYFFDAKFYGEIYSSIPLMLTSWVIPAVSFFSIYLFKKSKYFKYYLSLFLISLFVTLGANLPTGLIFEWLFLKIPYLQALRNPYEKFGLVYLLAYAPFFSVGAYVLADKFSKNRKNIFPFIILAVMFLVSGVYVWPMWAGSFAGGNKINPWIKVPDYYGEANQWLTTKGGDFRLLQLPLLLGDGLRYIWPNYYQGLEPSENLFTPSSISRNVLVNKPYYNILLERFDSFQPNAFGPDPDTSNSDFRGKTLAEELAKLNVRYIILHRDLDYKIAGSKSPEETEMLLLGQDKIRKVETFGQLDIYEVDVPDGVSLVYSPDVSVDYIKKSPTEYLAKVKDAVNSFDIYFLSLYDDGWEAYINGQKLDSHGKAFSYANSWNIDKSGDFEVLIKYAPQDKVIQGLKITKATLIGILLLLLLRLIYRKQTYRFGN